MNKSNLLVSIFITVLLFCSVSGFSGKGGVLDEAVYVPSETNLFLYADYRQIRGFLEKNDISSTDFLYLFSSGSVGTESEKLYNYFLNNIDRFFIATNADNSAKNVPFIVFFEVTGNMKDIESAMKSSPVEEVNGQQVYLVDSERKIELTMKGNLFVLGHRDYMRSYMKAGAAKRVSGDASLLRAIESSRRQGLYLYLPVGKYIRKQIEETMKKGGQYGKVFEGNVFIEAFKNLQWVSLSTRMQKKVEFDIDMVADNDMNGERVTMMSHFIIVGASFILPFAGQLSRSMAGKSLELKNNDMEKMQAVIGRIRTKEIDRGVHISFQLNDDETGQMVAAIRKAIAGKKEEVLLKQREALAEEIVAAAERDDAAQVKEKLSRMSNGDIRTKDGRSALLIAARKGNFEIAQMLLEKGAMVNVQDDRDGLSPLHGAVTTGKVPLVTLLLEKGADPALRDSFGQTSLHLAVKAGNADITRLLIAAGADVNAATLDKTTSLHIAALQGDMNIVKILIGAGASADVKDFYGDTPADKAESKGHGDIRDYINEHMKEKSVPSEQLRNI